MQSLNRYAKPKEEKRKTVTAEGSKTHALFF